MKIFQGVCWSKVSRHSLQKAKHLQLSKLGREFKVKSYLLNNSGKLNKSWRKRFLPSVEMTASFVIPNECEESRFMLRIS